MILLLAQDSEFYSVSSVASSSKGAISLSQCRRPHLLALEYYRCTVSLYDSSLYVGVVFLTIQRHHVSGPCVGSDDAAPKKPVANGKE